MIRRALRVLALGLACGSVAGCALLRPEGPGAPPASVSAMLEALDARREAVHALRARARVKAGIAALWTRQAVLVRRPDAVRIDVLSPFGVALALGTEDGALWIWPPSQGVRHEGSASPENLARILGTPLAMRDLVDVLLGLPPKREPVAPPTARRTDAGEWEVVLPLADGVQTLWFDEATSELRRAAEQRGEGPVLRVGFGDYQAGFPRTIAVEAPMLQSTATLAYDDVEIDPTLDDALFAPPPAPRVLPLDAVAIGG